jgi:hypothetical protein
VRFSSPPPPLPRLARPPPSHPPPPPPYTTGSSTGQAPGHDSEVLLQPVAIFKDPFRGAPNILVLCECVEPVGFTPIPSNTRRAAADAFAAKPSEKPWFGLEQEYTLFNPDKVTPLGWPVGGYPGPQGPYYCSAGTENSFGRLVVEAHYRACLYAGIKMSGINAEVLPGQWEYQVGPCEGISSGDQCWMARYIMYRVCEDFGVCVSFDPKPIPGDWNGSGMHSNYSTQAMREVRAPPPPPRRRPPYLLFTRDARTHTRRREATPPSSPPSRSWAPSTRSTLPRMARAMSAASRAATRPPASTSFRTAWRTAARPFASPATRSARRRATLRTAAPPPTPTPTWSRARSSPPPACKKHTFRIDALKIRNIVYKIPQKVGGGGRVILQPPRECQSPRQASRSAHPSGASPRQSQSPAPAAGPCGSGRRCGRGVGVSCGGGRRGGAGDGAQQPSTHLAHNVPLLQPLQRHLCGFPKVVLYKHVWLHVRVPDLERKVGRKGLNVVVVRKEKVAGAGEGVGGMDEVGRAQIPRRAGGRQRGPLTAIGGG